MKITLAPAPGPDGLRRVAWGTEPGPGWFTWDATEHELGDLLAVLEQDKAMGRYCDAEDGEHTCTMPPGHSILAHVCRACPREWR
jgi:hypothetical protein